MRTRTLLLAAVTAAVLASPGCFWTPELSQVRRQIEGGLPGVDFKKHIELSLGPGTLALARVATRFIRDEEFQRVRGCLRDVSRVQIAVYENRGEPAGESAVAMPERLRVLVEEGWEMVAKVNEGHDHVWILARSDHEAIRDVFVVVMDQRELVIVKARGRLDRVVERVLEDNTFTSARFAPPLEGTPCLHRGGGVPMMQAWQ